LLHGKGRQALLLRDARAGPKGRHRRAPGEYCSEKCGEVSDYEKREVTVGGREGRVKGDGTEGNGEGSAEDQTELEGGEQKGGGLYICQGETKRPGAPSRREMGVMLRMSVK